MKQHAPRFLKLVREAKQQIKEISPQELKKALESQQALYLIDVREDHELSSGHIPTAIHLSKGVIERDIEKIIPNPDEPIVVYCSGGFRCALVAQSLKAMGYTQVSSLETGSQGWVDAGYPLEK